MKSKIENYSIIAEKLKKEYSKLSEFEILSLSIQIERNEILENALAVSFNDEHPSALESIAIALGFKNGQTDTTITDAIIDLNNTKA